ncbi:MAG: hypothetical protein GY794_24240, partial [bacterium]|nr:hypothetical protein [bacterium]
GVITYGGGTASAGATCTVQADVASSTAGTHTNTSEALMSSLGTSSTASDTLTVNPPPGFSKGFGPDPIAAGGTSTLTFTIDNTGSSVAATGLSFTDNLPGGIVVASAPNASATCSGGTVTATAGAGVITYSGGTASAGATCTVQADVASTTAGTHTNTSEALMSSLGTSSTASDTLTVNPQSAFSKQFVPDAIAVGGTSTLTFSIDNSGSTVDATSLDFTDNLPSGVVVASTPSASTTCTGGTLTATAGASVVTYSGGTVSASGTCTLVVDVTSGTAGTYINTTGLLTSSLGSSGTATDILTVDPPAGFSKGFAPNPILVDGISTLTFTIDNTGNSVAATNLDFTDNLPSGVVVASTPNASATCSGGTVTATAGASVVTYNGGAVSAGGTCTVQADVTSATSGAYANVSGALTSSLGTSSTASDTLTVDPPLTFSKLFAPDSIAVGDTSTLTFTIDNSSSTVDATSLDFVDNLPAGVTIADPSSASTTCTGGTLTAVVGGSAITYTGGAVATGATCTVAVEVTSSAVDTHTNISGVLTSSLGSSGMATDTLDVIGNVLSMTKSFVAYQTTSGSSSTRVPTPASGVLRGGLVDLEYTILNTSAVHALSGIGFTDDLSTIVAGLAATSLPTNPCGAGSAITGSSQLSLSNGSLPPDGSCSFKVSLKVPASAPEGSFDGATSEVTADASGVSVAATAEAATLRIVFLGFSKSFDSLTLIAGATTDLWFTISNPDIGNEVSGITFTDDLNAVIPGLVAVGLPMTNVCGVGSTLTGTGFIILTGGALQRGGSCAFNVPIQVPSDAPPGSVTNVTSSINATIRGSGVEGAADNTATAAATVGAEAEAIPTLSQWALLLLFSMLVLAAYRQRLKA